MRGVLRFFAGLLVGLFLGAGGTIYFIGYSGTADLLLQRAQPMQDLEHKLRDAEQQRDGLSRQLEDLNARSNRMEQSFTELERRFAELKRGADEGGGGARREAAEPR